MALVRMRATSSRRLVGGRYRLGERLGAGAAGVVWHARDERLGRHVAVKQLVSRGLVAADVGRAHGDAAREGRIAARLQHPAVAAMLDMVVEDGSSWLVMEYVQGRSLSAVLQRAPLPPLAVARIGAQIADALAAAHAAGVVHSDVKPANVLLGDDGTVKLADFGIARAVRGERITGPGVLSGTPLFMAPEVARGQWPDAASDVYSLAGTLYAAVEGMSPYGPMDDGPLVMIRRVAETRPNPPRRAGPLTGVLGALLAADPARRPSAAATRDVLRAIAGPSTAPAIAALSSAAARGRMCTARRRRRALAPLSAVVAVGAAAGSIGGGGVMSMLTSVAPAPFDHVAISDGGRSPGPAGPSADSDRGASAPAPPHALPATAPPIVVPDRSRPPEPTATPVAADRGSASPLSSRVASTRAPSSTARARESLPVDAGVIDDVPIAGPVGATVLGGAPSTLDDVLPLDLAGGSLDSNEGPLLDLGDGSGVQLPADTVAGLPVELPVDLGSGLPVQLPVDLDVELPVDLPGGRPHGTTGSSEPTVSSESSGPTGSLRSDDGPLSILTFPKATSGTEVAEGGSTASTDADDEAADSDGEATDLDDGAAGPTGTNESGTGERHGATSTEDGTNGLSAALEGALGSAGAAGDG